MKEIRLSPLYVAVMAAAVVLSGCAGGGGGGGGSSTIRPDDGAGAGAGAGSGGGGGATPTINPNRITVDGGADVLVAVVDSGARVSHSEFQGGVLSSVYNVLDGGADVTDNDLSGHGTAMASIVAGATQGYSDNARLMVVKVTEGGLIAPSNHAAGFAYAANNGARVISDSSTSWRVSDEALAASYQAAVTNDAVWAAAAGNGGNDLTQFSGSRFFWDPTSAEDLAVRANLLLVGRLDAAGTDRDATSDYPGANADIQQRYVLAPGTSIGAADSTSDSALKNVSGTSPATAVAAALAAGIRSKWPHLSASESAQIILDTAQRTHTLYAQNNCGASSDLNCGDFFMGRGVLDADAALNPVGVLAMAMDGQVGGRSIAVASSNLTTSRAFGDAFTNLSALSAVHAFDDYGRNYAVDMRPTSMRATRSVLERTGGMGAFVQKSASPYSRFAYAVGKDTVSGWLRYDENGAPTSVAMRFRQGESTLTGYRLSLGEANPVSGPKGLEGLRMLSYTGNSDIANDYRVISGMSGEVPVAKRVSVGFDSWYSADSALGYKDASASRAEVAVRFAPTDWMRVSAGMASLTEKDSMLGVRGDGALGFRSGSSFVSQTLSLDVVPMAGATLFARYEQGTMGAVRGTLLIDSIKNIRASQFALGGTFGTKDMQAALVASAPLRVDSARAQFSTPVGRTIDGAVVTQGHAVDLAPSGRERSIEFALAARAGDSGTVQLNLARTLNAGHDESAEPVNSAVASYNVTF